MSNEANSVDRFTDLIVSGELAFCLYVSHHLLLIIETFKVFVTCLMTECIKNSPVGIALWRRHRSLKYIG